jgi:hypothetical protein
MRIVTAILLACISSLSCIAQEFEAPQTLVGFLKPGLQIGIRANQNSDRVTIAIYSKSDFEVAIDARHLKRDELASKHEKVAQEFERIRKEQVTSHASRQNELPPGKTFGEPNVSLMVNPFERLCTIIHTGDDYILVSEVIAPKKRRVISTRFISQIDWQDGMNFTVTVPHVSKREESSKP